MDKKERKIHITWAVVGGLALILGTVLFIYRDAAHMVFKNLTAMRLEMVESKDWNNGRSYEHISYAADSDSQYLDLYVPDTATNEELPKLLVLVHGGGFIYNDSQSRQAQLMYRYFRDNGYACATVNYRLAQEEPFPGALCDVKAAVRFLKAHADLYGFNADRVAIWGESAGGYLAVAATVTNDEEFMDVDYLGQEEYEKRTGGKASAHVDVCVDYYGAVELSLKDEDWKKLGIPKVVTDVANSWLHTDIMEGYPDVESFWLRTDVSKAPEEVIAYSNLYNYIDENIGREPSSGSGYAWDGSSIKFWISHGDCDITVPILQSERLYYTLKTLLPEESVVYRVVEGSGHAGDIMYTDEELSRVKNYLDENL